jgi:hypothetical protein
LGGGGHRGIKSTGGIGQTIGSDPPKGTTLSDDLKISNISTFWKPYSNGSLTKWVLLIKNKARVQSLQYFSEARDCIPYIKVNRLRGQSHEKLIVFS